MALYTQVVAKARSPSHFTALGVPDDSGSRLELIYAFATLLMLRMQAFGREGELSAQLLFDVLFEDVEQNLRVQGVSDQSIPKQMKKASALFMARYRDICAALEEKNHSMLAAVLERNIKAVSPEQVIDYQGLAGELLLQHTHLSSIEASQLLEDGHVEWKTMTAV